ncbi:MAG: YkgJ family cysteine cluster protein [Planctomycetota bacterium]|jgi:Fe-S-cluster containining protein|nr:YkgJ family cysteine cluster protein [Planctomycetota bacterium]
MSAPYPGDAAWFEAMRGFYRAVDRAVSRLGAACRSCGLCCHFEDGGQILFASRLERLYFGATAPAPPANPDGPAELLRSGGRCPFQAGGKCRARRGRPLGCRLHFCSRPAGEFSEFWHRRLKRLHESLGEEWRYAPFLPLRSAEKQAPRV